MTFRALFVVYVLMSVAPAFAGRPLLDHDIRLPKITTATISLGVAKAPWGWVDFCERHKGECDRQFTNSEPIRLSPNTWSMIEQVNGEVNSSIHEADDLEIYGVEERWEYPDSGLGDCEDFALLKRKKLASLGLPIQALLMTVVTDENGMGHAILTVQTNRGDFVLDNRTNSILAWQNTNYAFVKRQSSENPNIWVRIGIPNAPALTATGK